MSQRKVKIQAWEWLMSTLIVERVQQIVYRALDVFQNSETIVLQNLVIQR